MTTAGGAPLWRVCILLGLVLATLAWGPSAAWPGESLQRASTERWRAQRGDPIKLPLSSGTPDTNRLLTRLFHAQLALGTRMMIRIFKAESELEVWMLKDGVYVPFQTYSICYWSGTLGPKLREGDRQAPEGFYTLTEDGLHHGGRWRRSLNVGYPNVFDRTNGRSGSAILIHGGCDSIGCFAMTNPVNAELYDLVAAALRGAEHIPVHVFPFRMTEANMALYRAPAWTEFWQDLKLGYDSFERTRLPPHVSVCGKRYRFVDGVRGGRDAGAVEVCAEDQDLVPRHLRQDRPTDQTQASNARPAPPPACSMARASCRKWVALRHGNSHRTATARQTGSHRLQ